MAPRKVLTIKERVLAEAGAAAPRPVSRVAAVAVIANPFAGQAAADLAPLFDLGMALAEELLPDAVALLDGAPAGYG